MKIKKSLMIFSIVIFAVLVSLLIACPVSAPANDDDKDVPSKYGIVWFNNFEGYVISTATSDFEDATWDVDPDHDGWIVAASSEVSDDSHTNTTTCLKYTRTDAGGLPDGSDLINIPFEPDKDFDLSKAKYLIFWAKHNFPYGDNYLCFFKLGDGTVIEAWSNRIGIPHNWRAEGGIRDYWRRYAVNLDDINWSVTGSIPTEHCNPDFTQLESFSICAWDQNGTIWIDEMYLAESIYAAPPGVEPDTFNDEGLEYYNDPEAWKNEY